MENQLLFYLGLSLIILHEMDAMRLKEWRIIPVLSICSDNLGQLIFSLAHIPLFIWFFWAMSHNCNLNRLIFWFDIFLIIHVFLHLFFIKHKENGFKGFASWAIIIGAGLSGTFDLLLHIL
jgi:hypothetical protein